EWASHPALPARVPLRAVELDALGPDDDDAMLFLVVGHEIRKRTRVRRAHVLAEAIEGFVEGRPAPLVHDSAAELVREEERGIELAHCFGDLGHALHDLGAEK